MYWYVIHVKYEKYNDLLNYFNSQEDVHAFQPLIEKWFSNSQVKEYQSTLMYPDYIFIVTRLDNKQFVEKYKGVFMSIKRFAELLYNEEFLSLDKSEQSLFEKILDGHNTIKHSSGKIVNSVLKIEHGPLMGMEDMITKIDRHKRIAFLKCEMLGQTMKVPLEVTSKS